MVLWQATKVAGIMEPFLYLGVEMLLDVMHMIYILLQPLLYSDSSVCTYNQLKRKNPIFLIISMLIM